MNHQEEDAQPAPLPIEPGHVMRREKFEKLQKQQKQK